MKLVYLMLLKAKGRCSNSRRGGCSQLRPVAADLQSDAKYYQDFQSVKQSLSQNSQNDMCKLKLGKTLAENAELTFNFPLL